MLRRRVRPPAGYGPGVLALGDYHADAADGDPPLLATSRAMTDFPATKLPCRSG